jgi:hypothetical protein
MLGAYMYDTMSRVRVYVIWRRDLESRLVEQQTKSPKGLVTLAELLERVEGMVPWMCNQFQQYVQSVSAAYAYLTVEDSSFERHVLIDLWLCVCFSVHNSAEKKARNGNAPQRCLSAQGTKVTFTSHVTVA